MGAFLAPRFPPGRDVFLLHRSSTPPGEWYEGGGAPLYRPAALCAAAAPGSLQILLSSRKASPPANPLDPQSTDSPSYIASICALNFAVAAFRFTFIVGVSSPVSCVKSRSRMLNRLIVSYDGSVAFTLSIASWIFR